MKPSTKRDPARQLVRLILLAVAVLSPCDGFAELNLVGNRTKVSGATMTIYPPQEMKPLVTVRSERIYGDHQTRGFFKIGVLPMVKVEELRVELHQSDRVLAALTNLPALFGKHFELKSGLGIRGFSLGQSGSTNRVFTAQTVRLNTDTAWVFLNGEISTGAGQRLFFRRADLILNPSNAGELTCQTLNGEVKMNLRDLFDSHPKPNQRL